nr:MAG TPA: hypothetical protein [Caudoviricetes sp.]DAN26358.1 MAG TPA: hypothetical protein [Bacteriophage sp.]DAU13048.1 MAG TPA: hypothetical protein [Bacteriophage sp.]
MLRIEFEYSCCLFLFERIDNLPIIGRPTAQNQ